MNVRDLSKYRDLWIQILKDVHGSIPPADPNQLKQVKRPERKQIQIETLVSNYMPDLTAVLAAPGLGEFAGMGPNGQRQQQQPMGGGFGGGFGGGPPEFMTAPADAGAAPAEGAAPAAAGGGTRGFILTLNGTTPF